MVTYKINVNAKGIDDLKNKLKNNLPNGIAKAGEAVVKQAQAICPVDTGALRESIHSEAEGLTAIVSANTHYALYVEMGTYKMPAQPYLVPGLENSEADIEACIKEALGL